MEDNKYIITQVPSTFVNSKKEIAASDRQKIENYPVNSLFDSSTHRLEVSIFSLQGTKLTSIANHIDYSELLGAAGAGKEGASNLTLDPAADVKKLGYANGDVRIAYNFINDIYSDSKAPAHLFIESISSDRTEFRAVSNIVTDERLDEGTDVLIESLNSKGGLNNFKVNFGNLGEAIGVNAASDKVKEASAAVFKTYEPLPGSIKKGQVLTIEQLISDSVVFEVERVVEEDVIKVPVLKGANFNIEQSSDESENTEYFSYNELFSYPVTSSYYQMRSLFNEKSAQISINHNDFSDFIHFSSIEERLRNFKYKVDLLESYQNALTGSYTSGSISGSKAHNENLIEGIVNNFDHYDRFLYYESGSNSWPKVSGSVAPHLNQSSNTTESVLFFNRMITSASNYDVSNFDLLINSIPTFIREDSNNEPYLMFIHMLGQHFDNLWIYFKAVSDKYDADNRLDFGISKDLVKDAIESLGIKLYSTNFNSEDLFSMFSGEQLNTGSRVINEIFKIEDEAENDTLQPVSKDDYQKEIYKRIYHNVPHLLKTKGTQRGLRALINTFGIPEEILKIKTFGGTDRRERVYVSPKDYYTDSLDKVRLDTTGSFITGSTLSKYATVIRKDRDYSDDSHIVEIGFDIAEVVDDYHYRQLTGSLNTGSFNIDDYIGDPRNAESIEYYNLDQIADDYNRNYGIVVEEKLTVLGKESGNEIITEDGFNILVDFESKSSGITFAQDASAFIKLAQVFDNSLFRMVKDFLPARTTANTGIIVKAPKIQRSKAKQVSVSWENKIYTGSIEVANLSGSDGGAFPKGNHTPYTTNYERTIVTPLGPVPKNVTDENPKYTGEFSGSLVIATDGELTKNNPFKKQTQPIIRYDLTVFNLSLPIPPACNLFIDVTYIGEYFTIGTTTGGTVSITSPVNVGPIVSGSTHYTHDFDTFEFFTIDAQAGYYPYGTFDGWFDAETGGNLISTASTHTIYHEDENNTSGSVYYAQFS